VICGCFSALAASVTDLSKETAVCSEISADHPANSFSPE
jgi:hypothetical protein